MCALLGRMRVFAVYGHKGAGGTRVGAMMNWVDGLGWGVGFGIGSRTGLGGWGVSGVGIV